MKLDVLSSPGLLPNAGRLHAEIVKAVSFCEVQRDLLGRGPSQGKTLDDFLVATRSYLSTKGLIDAAVPTTSGAAVNGANKKLLTITFSEPLDASVTPAPSAFTVSGSNPVTAVQVSGNQVRLLLTNDSPTSGQTVGYTKPGTNTLRDPSGNEVATFSSLAVTYTA